MNARGTPGSGFTYLYRTLCALCAAAAVWTLVLALTGGFTVELGGVRIASRRPRNAAVIALFFAAVVAVVSFLPATRESVRNEWARWRRLWSSLTNLRGRASNVLRIVLSPFAIAIVAIAFDISQWIAALPLWVDEEMIALNVRDRSIGELAGALWLGQSAPLGWLVVQRAVISVLGAGEQALRMVPLLFGIATVALAAWTGRRWMGWIAAVAFVVLCWISTFIAHYRFEVKHYTADAFFGLLLPVLAVWAMESDRADERARRLAWWWIAAIAGHWVSNGALFVTPACALFLLAANWRHGGARAAAWFSAGGLVWLASFGVNYVSSLSYTRNSTYFRSQWGSELLPESAGVVDAAQWFLGRFEPLARNPGATALWVALWLTALCGWLFGTRRALGVVLALVVLSAFPLAAIVPMHERFSIWIVPALYAGVVLLLDRAAAAGREALSARRWAVAALAATILFIQLRLCADIFSRGKAELDARRHSTDKHQLDDREAVRWLMAQRQPGDVLMTTHLALPAVWWYGGIAISDDRGAGGVFPDGSPVFEVDATNECPSRQFEEALKNSPRVLLYLGFDVIPGFDHVLLSHLAQHGDVTAHRQFSKLGLAAIIDLRVPPSGRPLQLTRGEAFSPTSSGGCVKLRRAARW